MTTLKQPRILSPRRLIANAIWEELKAFGKPAYYPALVKRVGELLDEFDFDCVLAVCLELVWEAGREFTPWTSLADGRFEYMRRYHHVPDGAWTYHLWMRTEDRPLIRDSLSYWIDRWEVAAYSGDDDEVRRVRERLKVLEKGYWKRRYVIGAAISILLPKS